MGTRGAVAVRTSPGTWKGVYNHFDSYPSGLGAEVWKEVKRKGVEVVSKGVLKVGDWREYLSKGICEFCGKKLGQPHSIEGPVFGYEDGKDFTGNRAAKLKSKNVKELAAAIKSSFGGEFIDSDRALVAAKKEWPIVQSMKKIGYPDPGGLYHKHGEGKKDQITEKTVDTLFIEWTYILDTKRNRIEIWHHRVAGGRPKKGEESPKYELFKVTEVSPIGPEPDWTKVQRTASKMAGYDEE